VLSEVTQLSTKELRGWLESQTSVTLTPVQSQAKKLLDNMTSSMQTVTEISQMLLDNSTNEIEKRNMKIYNRARALNKLAHLFLDRLKKLTPPQQITYDNLNKYTQETQKILLVTDIDIKNWFPRISPFFIMDRRKFLTVHERSKQSFNALNDFVTKEYVKTKTLEETFQLTDELHANEQKIADLQSEVSAIKNELAPIDKEIAELDQKITSLKSEGAIDALKNVNAEIEALNNELKNLLRHLQKPFIKMQALATSGGGGGVTPDELREITEYLDAPFDALSTEATGYPMLKEILRKLAGLLKEDTLKLKQDKARKAEQSLNEILQSNNLFALQERTVKLAADRAQLNSSAQLAETNRCVAAFADQLEQLKTRKISVDAHLAVKEHECADVASQCLSLKRSIERNINVTLNKKVQLT
jgi:hypothetical protein